MTAREVEILKRLVEDVRENPRPVWINPRPVWIYEDVLCAIESALELWLPEPARPGSYEQQGLGFSTSPAEMSVENPPASARKPADRNGE